MVGGSGSFPSPGSDDILVDRVTTNSKSPGRDEILVARIIPKFKSPVGTQHR